MFSLISTKLSIGWCQFGCGGLGPFHTLLSPLLVFAPPSLLALGTYQTTTTSSFLILLPFFVLVGFHRVLGLSAVFTPAPSSLVLAKGATTAIFTLAPYTLVLAYAATAAFYTLAPPSLVLA